MDGVQLISILISAGLLVTVLELVRRRRLSEEYSLIWIVSALVLLALAIGRGQVDSLALWLGIYYPPALLILTVIFIMFIVSLHFSLAISRQREQIERLIEEVALLSAWQREQTEFPRGHAPAGSPPDEAARADAQDGRKRRTQ